MEKNSKNLNKKNEQQRPNTTISQRENKIKIKEINPIKIQEIRVKTYDLEQQTKLLKAHLSRIKDNINSKTKAINKTVHNSGVLFPSGKQNKIIENLQQSIESARNTLISLNNKIKEAEIEDKSSIVEELKQDLIISFEEYQRLDEEIKNYNKLTEEVKNKLDYCNLITSDEYFNKTNLIINNFKNSNKELNSKVDAYSKKKLRMKIDLLYHQSLEQQKDKDLIEKEIYCRTKFIIEKHNLYIDQINFLKNEHSENINILENQINLMRKKIIEHLNKDVIE